MHYFESVTGLIHMELAPPLFFLQGRGQLLCNDNY